VSPEAGGKLANEGAVAGSTTRVVISELRESVERQHGTKQKAMVNTSKKTEERHLQGKEKGKRISWKTSAVRGKRIFEPRRRTWANL